MNKMIQLTMRAVRDEAIKVHMTERVKRNKVVINKLINETEAMEVCKVLWDRTK